MSFCDRAVVRAAFEGKRVALVGSGPGVLDNEIGFVDSHDVIVRVNNYRLSPPAGFRCDVFYSFFGSSIEKTAAELKRDGVRLCISKCPDEKFMESAWHRKRKKPNGVDFRYIYTMRNGWWFCDTYITPLPKFMEWFDLLDGHVPTTGFAALLEILEHHPASVLMTGFDGFTSGLHNVDQRWRPGDTTDPIGHRPELELAWISSNRNLPLTFDKKMASVLAVSSEAFCKCDPMTIEADTGTARVSRLATEKWGDGILRRSALSIRGGAGVFDWALCGKGIRTVLEIGTYRGVSAAAMAQYVDRVVTIDLKRGRLEQTDPAFDRHQFWNSLGISNVELILVEDDAEKKAIVDAMEFDFAFIDGAHDATVRNDFELVKRCGRVLFHDADDNRKRGFKKHAPNDVFEFLKTLPQQQLQFMDIFCLWKAT